MVKEEGAMTKQRIGNAHHGGARVAAESGA
jgi:hypothetical protein